MAYETRNNSADATTEVVSNGCVIRSFDWLKYGTASNALGVAVAYIEDLKVADSNPKQLSKRDTFAAMALQGLLAGHDTDDFNPENTSFYMAGFAVDCADALLAELRK